MLKKVLAALLLLATAVGTATAKEYTDEQKKKIKKAKVQPTCIITLGGDTVYGYSRALKVNQAEKSMTVMGKTTLSVETYYPYWEQQDCVEFITEADFDAADKPKGSMFKKYKPSGLKGYIIDYDDDFSEKKVFDSVKFKTWAFSGETTMSGTYFLRRVDECKNGDMQYTVYLTYKKMEVITTIDYVEPYLTPHKAIRFKGTNEVKCAEDLNPEKDYPCPLIAERAKKNEYTNLSSKKESKLNKLAKMAAKYDDDNKHDMRRRAFEDYISSCAND